MSKPCLILIGAGGHAQACIDVIEQHGGYRIAGLVGLPDQVNTQCLGYAVIATDNDLVDLAKRYRYAVIAVGHIQSSCGRSRLYQRAATLGFELPGIVSPTAYVSPTARIGSGSIVMHGAIINSGAKVGNNCIINTRALIEHGAIVEDHCHISTGAILNGDVHIGAGTFIGSGSVVREGVSVGKSCVVGMGLALRHDRPDNTRFVGGEPS